MVRRCRTQWQWFSSAFWKNIKECGTDENFHLLLARQTSMDNSNIEESDFTCPITLERFHDPVFAADGHVYEREAITRWVNNHGTSPLTRAPLRINDFQPYDPLKHLTASRPNTTVSYSAHADAVTLPPLRRLLRNDTRIAPAVLTAEPLEPDRAVATSQSTWQCSRRCLIRGLLFLSCCSLLIIAVAVGAVLAWVIFGRPEQSTYQDSYHCNGRCHEG